MGKDLLAKYIWIVQTFIKAGERGLTLDELQDRWFDRFDCEYPRRSFNNHRIAIGDVFGIDIECDRSTNRYYIPFTDDVSDDEAASRWLINTFTVGNMLAESHDRLSGRVSVEDVPSGQTWLTAIMEAMTTETTLCIKYRKYGSSEPEELYVDPYAIKESARRWYLVAWCHEREAMRVYGLDRIQSLWETTMDFDLPKGFDVDEYFRGSFGIYKPSGDPVEIVLRATPKEAGYLRDLPLHSSQKELGTDENGFATFSIEVCPGRDLIMELCKHASGIEIVSPPAVRQELVSELKKTLEKYK